MNWSKIMDEGKNKRITALKNAAEEKKKLCFESTNEAIKKLTSINKPLTIANVAREAGVSASYIYKYPELKKRIIFLKNQQSFKLNINKGASNNSRHTIIYHLKDEIKSLRKEVAEFKRTNQLLVGKIYDYQNIQGEIEELRTTNKKQSELIFELQSKLHKAKEDLEACSNSIVEANPKVISLGKEIENVNNKTSIDDEIRSRLSPLVTRISSTLIKTLESKSKQEIIDAISAVEEYIDTGKKVKSKSGLLRKALEENWMPNCTDRERETNKIIDSFSEWYELAKEQGIAKASQRTKDGKGVLVLEPTGDWTPLETIMEKGWTLEYLRKRKAR